MTLHPINKDGQRNKTGLFKLADQLENVGLLGDDMLAVEEEADDRGGCGSILCSFVTRL